MTRPRASVPAATGARKTVLANELGVCLGMPVMHIEAHSYRTLDGERVESTPGQWRPCHRRLIWQEAWVLDGMKLGVLAERFARADAVISISSSRRFSALAGFCDAGSASAAGAARISGSMAGSAGSPCGGRGRFAPPAAAAARAARRLRWTADRSAPPARRAPVPDQPRRDRGTGAGAPGRRLAAGIDLADAAGRLEWRGMSALRMQPAVLSETGRRARNEDAVFASPRLVAVADGVGGAVAGELASRLAIQKLMMLDKRRLASPLVQELQDAVADANDVIAFAISYDPRCTGMATTLTAVALSNDGVYLLANIGDSRTYLLRDRQLRRLTRDHSLVQALLDQGVLTEADARHHPQRSVILDALDGARRPLPALQTVQARAGDRLLLCSDGVTDYLTDTQIAELTGTTDARVAVRQIVSAALEHGSRDNITAIIADVTTSGQPCDGWLPSLPAPDRRV